MILIIDNYDSFTYNLYQYVGEMNNKIFVIRNDEVSVKDIEKLNPEKIILSLDREGLKMQAYALMSLKV